MNKERSFAGRVGFITPWNQSCGLATYAHYMLQELQRLGLDFTVFAERTEAAVPSDEGFVRRCWSRVRPADQVDDYQQLEAEVERAGISVLHINCQARFFHPVTFSKFLQRMRGRGVRVVVQLHNLFTLGEDLSTLVAGADRIFVHTPENRLEAIANGAMPDAVEVVPHGVLVRPEISPDARHALRNQLGIANGEYLLITFGFVQPHKGLESLVEAVTHLRERGLPARGVIIGETRADDPNSAAYMRALRELVNRSGVTDHVSFINTFVPDEQVGEYLSAADLVIMNYRSQHFEASGACALAVGAGAAVLTSLAPAMMTFGDAVWHMTSGYPVGLSAELVLTNQILQGEIRSRARAYAERHSWQQIARQLAAKYAELVPAAAAPVQTPAPESRTTRESAVKNKVYRGSGKPVRVLIQNRPNTFTQRGGDTVLVEKISQGLAVRGYEVRVDVEGLQNAADYDLVHLFNFATPKLTEHFAQRAKAAGRPFVVTSLYEDLPQFHTQSHAVARSLMEYVSSGQRQEWWQANKVDVRAVAPAARFPADWIAQHASAILANGSGEAAALKRDFPAAEAIRTVHVGHETGMLGDASLFERTYGVRDFVLCVGRLESRKNQLMLLKALEESELTVVLAAGGFSYQPDYDGTVRNFKRRGKTVIADRLSPEMLSAAYAACRIHVLPSWYELPGLVSLEAAAHGKNIVATRTGTTENYLGDKAFYCHPWDEESIRSSVLAAFHAPVTEGLVDMARSYTWERAVDETIAEYEAVLGIKADAALPDPVAAAEPVVPSFGVYDMSMSVSEVEEMLEQGEAAAKAMEFERAEQVLRAVQALDPNSPRVLKSLGAVMLAQSRCDEARRLFDQALEVSPADSKVLTGRGMCEAMSGHPAKALPFLEKSLDVAPDNLVALHQLLECSYQLDQYEQAEKRVKRYLACAPEDAEMRYCLAGCLYKMGELTECLEHLSAVLAAKPEHVGGQELKEKAERLMSEQQGATVAVAAHSAIAETEALTPAFSTEVLAGLSQRIQDWKISGSAEASPTVVITQPAAKSPSPAVPSVSPGESVEERIACVESLKRSGKLTQAKEVLDTMLPGAGLTTTQEEMVSCLNAEFKVIMGELEEAARIYNKLLDRNPHFSRALCGQGALAAEAQEWGTAQAFFETSLDYNPSYDVAIAGLGLCKMVANKPEEAFNLFRRAATINPENYRAVLGVLQLGYPLKRYQEMESLLLSYLKLYPSNIDMTYSLAGLLFSQGKISQARIEVEKILESSPKHEPALELREILVRAQTSPTVMM